MLEILARLANVAEGQYGHVTEAQATAVGATPEDVSRLFQARVTEPVVDGVFRLRGGGRHPYPRLFAQWLLLDPECYGWERQNPRSGVASHRSALRVHALGDWPGPTAEFTLASGSDLRQAEGVHLHTAQLGSDEWQLVAGLPVTSPSRTLGDLAVNPHADREALGRLAAAILRRGLASHQDLARALNRCDPPHGGAKHLEDLLATQGGDL